MHSKAPSIHDKFIKELLSDSEIVVSFLESYLPKKLLQEINLQSITHEKTSYVSSSLKESFSDVVWRFATKTDKKIKVCLLLEHKSYKDENVVFQILEYLALGYQQQIKNKKPVELIVPILYYHGQDKWHLKEFHTYFENYSLDLQKYLPFYKTEFVNLNEMSSQQITSLGHGMLRSALLIQKHYFDPEKIFQNIDSILNSLSPYLEKNLSNSIFVYLIQFIDLDKEKFSKRLEQIPENLNSRIMSLYDQLILEGVEKGIEKGIEKETEKVVLNSFKNGFSIENIRLITGETVEIINAILKKNGLI